MRAPKFDGRKIAQNSLRMLPMQKKGGVVGAIGRTASPQALYLKSDCLVVTDATRAKG
jgi:hypothetical protein